MCSNTLKLKFVLLTNLILKYENEKNLKKCARTHVIKRKTKK